MTYTVVTNFDVGQIPETSQPATFHADATYVFDHLSSDVIPALNTNFDLLNTAFDGADTVLAGLANKVNVSDISDVADLSDTTDGNDVKLATRGVINAHVETYVEKRTEFISSATLASDASVVFTGFDSAKYESYEFLIKNVIPSVSAAWLTGQLSDDGGTTFFAAPSYSYEVASQRAGGLDGSAGPAAYFGQNGNVVARGGLSGKVRLFNQDDFSHTSLLGHMVGQVEATPYAWTSGAVQKTTAYIDAIKFSFNSGLLASGKIEMHGVLHT